MPKVKPGRHHQRQVVRIRARIPEGIAREGKTPTILAITLTKNNTAIRAALAERRPELDVRSGFEKVKRRKQRHRHRLEAPLYVRDK